MELTLAVLRCPDSAVPETRQARGDFSIGRGPGNDWVLPDPDRVLSKRHCVLEFRAGGWQLRDLSTNGTYLNQAGAPVGRDRAVPVSDGDRLRFGAWEIELRLAQAARPAAESSLLQGSLPMAPETAPPAGAEPWRGADPFAAPPGAALDPLFDPMAPPPPPHRPFGETGPAPLDPFGEGEAPMPDHRPSTNDAFRPPSAHAAATIPEDWDLDLPGAAPPPPAPPLPAQAPFAPPPAPPVAPPPPAADAGLPFDPPPASVPPAPAPPPVPPPAAAALPFAPAPAPAPSPAPMPPPVAPFAAAPAPMAYPAAPPQPGAPDALLAAFLQGAALPPHALAGVAPEAALHAAGQLSRLALAGLRALLIARADAKREFRIEQTMLRASGNNPVKFAASDAAALQGLLSAPDAAAAVQEIVTDLAAHQAAGLAATQAAARALLDRLAPARLEAEDQGGGLMPGAREKRLWDRYKALHRATSDQFDDDFDSAFGKAFARAYEDALRGGRG